MLLRVISLIFNKNREGGEQNLGALQIELILLRIVILVLYELFLVSYVRSELVKSDTSHSIVFQLVYEYTVIDSVERFRLKKKKCS